jgi:hypothetical protein
VREGENLGMTEDEIIEYIRKEQKEQKGRE